MTRYQKLLIRDFEDIGGAGIGLYTQFAHRLGLYTKTEFQKDIEAITTLESNSLQTRSLQISLGLVAVQNFHQN